VKYIVGKNKSHFEVDAWLNDGEKTVACVELSGRGRRSVNRGSDTTYEVISSTVTFNVGTDQDMRLFVVGAGHSVMIERGTPYYDTGHDADNPEGFAVMLATSKPPFDPKAVEILENNIQ